MNTNNVEEQLAKLKKKFVKKSELDYVKLTILGQGTCFGDDDYFKEKIILKKRAKKSEWECKNNPKLQLTGRSYNCKVLSSKLKVYELTGDKIHEAFTLLGHYKIPFFKKSKIKRNWVNDRMENGSDISTLMNKYSDSQDTYADISKRLHPGNMKIENPRKIKYAVNKSKPVECPQR